MLTSNKTLLSTLTKSPITPDEHKIRFARSAYFTRVIGIPVSVPEYTAWLANHPDHPSPDPSLLASLLDPAASEKESEPSQAEEDSSRPAWQAAAPKAELYIDRSGEASTADQSSADGPAYPSRFAELIRCIKEGLPVPGVREIPETIVRDPVSVTALVFLFFVPH